jgi:hypothetical protein
MAITDGNNIELDGRDGRGKRDPQQLSPRARCLDA